MAVPTVGVKEAILGYADIGRFDLGSGLLDIFVIVVVVVSSVAQLRPNFR